MTNKEAYDILIGCHITAATPSCREVEDALIVALNALKEQEKYRWVSVDERLPSEHDGDYLLLSFAAFDLPLVGKYEEDCDGGGNFYLADDEETLLPQDIIVNAWRRLPEPYKESEEE